MLSVDAHIAPLLERVLTAESRDFLGNAARAVDAHSADLTGQGDDIGELMSTALLPTEPTSVAEDFEIASVGPPGEYFLAKSIAAAVDVCIFDFRYLLADRTAARLTAWQLIQNKYEHSPGPVVRLPSLACNLPEIRIGDEPISACLLDATLALQMTAEGHRVELMLSGIADSTAAAALGSILEIAIADQRIREDQVSLWLCIDDISALACLDDIRAALPFAIERVGLDTRGLVSSFIRHFPTDPMRVLPDYSSLAGSARFLRIAECLIASHSAAGGMSVFSTPISMRIDNRNPEQKDALTDAIRDQTIAAQSGGCGTILVSDPSIAGFVREAGRLPSRGFAARPAEFTTADLLHTPRGRITSYEIRRHINRALSFAGFTGLSTAIPMTDEDIVDPDSFLLACRQLWQWCRHPTGIIDEGRPIDSAMLGRLLEGNGGCAINEQHWLKTVLTADTPPDENALASILQGL